MHAREVEHRTAMRDPETQVPRDLPLDCYWICTAPGFEIDICVSAQQVTFILLSPEIPSQGMEEKNSPALTFQEPIWVVERMTPQQAGEAINRPAGVVTSGESLIEEQSSVIVAEQIRNFPAKLTRIPSSLGSFPTPSVKS